MLNTLYGDNNKAMWQSLVPTCTESLDTYYILVDHNLALAGYYTIAISFIFLHASRYL